MTNSQLEVWVLEILDRARRRLPLEDDRIELKADWIDAHKAARRIAAHANQSRGEPFIWIIGIDERTGRHYNFQPDDYAAWWPQVVSHFDGIPPSPQFLNVPTESGVIVAIRFAPDRAPYVIKLKDQRGFVSREVPWREGTRVESANRSQLLHLLIPQTVLPEVEVVAASADIQVSRTNVVAESGQGGHFIRTRIEAKLHVSSPMHERFVIPYHRCRMQLRDRNGGEILSDDSNPDILYPESLSPPTKDVFTPPFYSALPMRLWIWRAQLECDLTAGMRSTPLIFHDRNPCHRKYCSALELPWIGRLR